ncbi:MAG: hypothetical protein COB66_02810 [Coxiella sp. (in: Bacteria)]|nr:MAG: hypothetical protein COB66_02810 [Coxiella sp. (in: g-proteobacteria)]
MEYLVAQKELTQYGRKERTEYARAFIGSRAILENSVKWEATELDMATFNQFGRACSFKIVTYLNQTINPLIGASDGLCEGILKEAIERDHIQNSDDIKILDSADDAGAYIKWIQRIQEIHRNQSNRTFIEETFTVQRLSFRHYFTQADYLTKNFIRHAKSNTGFFVTAVLGSSNSTEQHVIALRINRDHSFEFIDANCFHIKSDPFTDLDEACDEITDFFNYEYLKNTRVVDVWYMPGQKDGHDNVSFKVIKPKIEAIKHTLLGKIRSIVNGPKYAPHSDGLFGIWIKIRRVVTRIQRCFSVTKPANKPAQVATSADTVDTTTVTTLLLPSEQRVPKARQPAGFQERTATTVEINYSDKLFKVKSTSETNPAQPQSSPKMVT